LKSSPYLGKIGHKTTRGKVYGSDMTFALFILSVALIALALSVIMSGAWLIRERTGNSG
jgi:hypothetical protein